MSLYNSIEKIKYKDDLSDAVSLEEYIVFANERSEEKYIVFKFSNNVNQKLLGMKFEVSQYDMNGDIIEKSIVVYNNFSAKANSSFVPKAKLKALYACKRISVRLLQAAFERVMWNEGEYIDNSYKFEHYARDEKYIEEANRPKVTQKPAPVKLTIEETERFRAKNIMKKNVAVFPKVFFWIACILLLAAIGVGVVLFPRVSKRFTLSGYDLERISDYNVRIVGYEGDDAALVVPSEIEGYLVVGIGEGAFRHLSVRTITLPETIAEIRTGAFSALPDLRIVTCSSPSVVLKPRAFDGVASLMSFDMRGAKLEGKCFYGCLGLSQITFGETFVAKFVDLFDVKKYDTFVTLFSGSYQKSATFFEGANYAVT